MKNQDELDSVPIPIKYVAKDGTDFPPIRQFFLMESPFYRVGETADFEFKPLKAGVYDLKIIVREGVYFWNQKWIVKD